MPPHPDHHPLHKDHPRGWIVAHHDPEATREGFAETLSSLGSLVEQSRIVTINGTNIAIPDAVDFELVYERTPHGALALRLRAEWPEVSEVADPVPSTDLRLTSPAQEGA